MHCMKCKGWATPAHDEGCYYAVDGRDFVSPEKAAEEKAAKEKKPVEG